MNVLSLSLSLSIPPSLLSCFPPSPPVCFSLPSSSLFNMYTNTTYRAVTPTPTHTTTLTHNHTHTDTPTPTHTHTPTPTPTHSQTYGAATLRLVKALNPTGTVIMLLVMLVSCGTPRTMLLVKSISSPVITASIRTVHVRLSVTS